MYVPTTLGPVRKEDFTVLPFDANKEFTILSATAEQLGYTVRQGLYYGRPLALSSSKTYPTNTDETYKYTIWNSLNHLYYKNGYDFGKTFEGFNQDKTEKHLFITASLVSVPYLDMGQGIKPKSVKIVLNDGTVLQDDGNYNLYESYEYSPDELEHLQAYWGFQDLYKYTKQGFTNTLTAVTQLQNGAKIPLYETAYNNVQLETGIPIGPPGNTTGSGAGVAFNSTDSYIITRNFDEINYELDDEFTISFWLKCPTSQSVVDQPTNSIITKRTYEWLQKSGEVATYLQNDQQVTRRILESGLYEVPTNVYPYDLSIYNQTAPIDLQGKVLFQRSDGTTTTTLTSSVAINDGQYHHIAVSKSGSLIRMYIDGKYDYGTDALNPLEYTEVQDTISQQPTNYKYVILGAADKVGTQQLSGSLDEVRIYNTKAFTQLNELFISSLASNYDLKAYQTTKVGNVFYKRGDIVITSVLPKHHEQFNNGWTLQYNNVYTIYEYETLVRVPANQFNKTMNPTSKKSPQSDEYLDAMNGGTLYPYITTIGLYNSNFELVAVGKLGRPIKNRNDVDMNFIVRWDY